MFKTLEELIKIIKKQKKNNSKVSYTASLFKKGKNFCIKKFMEEARELAASSKYSNKKNANKLTWGLHRSLINNGIIGVSKDSKRI